MVCVSDAFVYEVVGVNKIIVISSRSRLMQMEGMAVNVSTFYCQHSCRTNRSPTQGL